MTSSYGKKLIEQGYKWYELTYEAPGMLNEKIVFPDISPENRFAYDESGEFACLDTIYYLVRNDDEHEYKSDSLTAILNSKLLNYIFKNLSPTVRGGYLRYKSQYVEGLPIPKSLPENDEQLRELSEKITDLKQQRNAENLNLLDYLGTYEDGRTLGERYQPASGLADSVLTDTVADSEFENLRVTNVEIERDGDRLRVLAVPYVKPNDPEAYETNGRGYATLEPVPAMEFVRLEEAQADLIEAFVPHAVAEADGFAGYRDNATATISPLDRLEGLTLPALADAKGGIERYLDTRERVVELEEEIERTDELIDEIVYELYGLTDEEIGIIEEAVGN